MGAALLLTWFTQITGRCFIAPVFDLILALWCWREVFIEQARFFIGSAACAWSADAQNFHLMIERNGQNSTGRNLFGGRIYALTIEPDMALLHKPIGEGARFDDTGKPEPFIKTLAFALSILARVARRSGQTNLRLFLRQVD
jgi:hypothetical protein